MFELTITVITNDFIDELQHIMGLWEQGISAKDWAEEDTQDLDDEFWDDVDETFYDPYAGCEIWDNCNYEW